MKTVLKDAFASYLDKVSANTLKVASNLAIRIASEKLSRNCQQMKLSNG